jgi:hypothetical protein
MHALREPIFLVLIFRKQSLRLTHEPALPVIFFSCSSSPSKSVQSVPTQFNQLKGKKFFYGM